MQHISAREGASPKYNTKTTLRRCDANNYKAFFAALTIASSRLLAGQTNTIDSTNAPTQSETLIVRDLNAAGKYFQSFPDKLPKAASVKKFPVQGATYVLVHIKQTHEISLLGSPLIARGSVDRRRIDNVQNNIRVIFGGLAMVGVETGPVFFEGATPESLQMELPLVAALKPFLEKRTALQQRIASGQSVQKDSAELADIDARLTQLQQRLVDTSQNFFTEVFIQTSLGRELLPFETPRSKEIADKVLGPVRKASAIQEEIEALVIKIEDLEKHGGNSEQVKKLDLAGVKLAEKRDAHLAEFKHNKEAFKEELFTVREEEIIRVVACALSLEARKAQTAALPAGTIVMGGEHQLWAEIQAYNLLNPQNKFALIEVQPLE